MLIINTGLTISLIIIFSNYLLKNNLIYTILVIYLKTNLFEIFNLILDYILIKTLNPDNQNNILYKTLY